ncbi:hypothetical protein J7438_01495 [Thalassotalea sp. G20_0]|uniref:hypothetical protein n=1 Tax=Thalassotalea sp. G20_0 TaxID=2821093 RepID=UPI001ADAE0ED|nr:hypothetical protein [Thalassotalea sp. G20_0]MBO9492767.1 hypothetical protein [Thalassotalea sp. G20_0]
MKTLLLLISIITANTSMASVIITDWYRLSGSGAEVCFRIFPSSGQPELVRVTVDKGHSKEAHYLTWVTSDEKYCKVVATTKGRVEVQQHNTSESDSKYFNLFH